MKIQYRTIIPLMMCAALVFSACDDGGSSNVPVIIDPGSGGTVTIDPPENVTVALVLSRQIIMTWDEVPDADSYNIYYKTSPGVTTSDTQITGVTSPYGHYPSKNGTTYYFAVTAVNDGVESSLSSEVSGLPDFTSTPLDKLAAFDGQANDNFGGSVSITGNYAIIGAKYEDGGDGNPFINAGAAYISRRDGENWIGRMPVWAPDAGVNDYFGCSVSISGDYAVVGAYGEDGGAGDTMTDAGAAYIFHRTDTNTWDSGTKITAPDAAAGDNFGSSVSISGDYVIVGASNEDGSGGAATDDRGAAYIFHRIGTTTWDAGVKIIASDALIDDYFGIAVAIDGDYAIVGASADDVLSSTTVTDAGSAYIFHRTGTNEWDIGTKIMATDAQTSDRFGRSVAINGEYAIIGADLEDGSSASSDYSSGAAYIFHRTGNDWLSSVKITASDPRQGDYFGWSVSISGDYALVGSQLADGDDDYSLTDAGAAYLFRRTGTNTWGDVTKFLAPDGHIADSFGYSVSIDGDFFIVGAYYDDAMAGNAGAVYMY